MNKWILAILRNWKSIRFFFDKSTENTLLINLVSLVRKMRKRKFACKPTITVSIGDTNKHEGSTKKKEHIPNLMLPFGDLERV